MIQKKKVRQVGKLYVNEIRPNGEVSTVGLFYSWEEAESVVRQLRSLPEKRDCQYAITETVPTPATSTEHAEA